MRELRRLEVALAEAFERFGYGEVATPTIEYHEVLARGDERGRARRVPLLRRERRAAGDALRHDGPDRPPGRRRGSASAEPPFRLCYIAHAYRAIRPQRGQMREFTQAGVELIGVEAPEGTAEVVEVLSAALDAAGLTRAVIGLGDADLYRQLLDELGVDGRAPRPHPGGARDA